MISTRMRPAAIAILGAALALFCVGARAGDQPDARQKKTVKTVVVESAPGAYLGLRLSEDTETPEGGAKVERVLPGSPAEKAGVAEGDVVIAFRDTPIHGPAALTKQIRAAKPGEKVQLTVLRSGKKQTLTVELSERQEQHVRVKVPGHEEDIVIPDLESLQKDLAGATLDRARAEREIAKLKGIAPPAGRHSWRGITIFSDRPKLGVELVETTPELREFLGGNRDAGVLVGKVLSPSAAEKAGIRVGDLIVSVDGTAIEDAGGLVEALSDKDGKTIDLEIVRDKRVQHVKAEIPAEEEDEPTGPRARSTIAPPTPAPPLPAECPTPPPPPVPERAEV